MQKKPSPVRLVVRIDFDDTRYIGHGRIELLELIDEHGSIAEAARAMDMSYRRAWLLVESINQTFKTPVVDRQHGGKGGGAARLTPLGRKVVAAYRDIEREASAAAGKSIRTLTRALG